MYLHAYALVYATSIKTEGMIVVKLYIAFNILRQFRNNKSICGIYYPDTKLTGIFSYI